MEARPYQQAVLSAVTRGWREFRKQLVVMPTGSGKTCVFSWLAQAEQPGRTLILAHRDELVDQAIDKLHKATGLMAQKEKAEFTASLQAPVVVASIQTMRRRLEKWPADHFSLVVCDEAHHVLADEWQSVMQHFTSRVLGVTATSDRGDKRNLGQFFENVAHEVSLFELINQGYLSRIHVKAIPLKIDLSSVKITKGDYDANGLGSVIEPYLAAIAEKIKVEAAERRTLVFLPLIATSQLFVEKCQEIGINARHIDGQSPDRKEILADFANDKFELLSNSALLFEGYDDPGIDCIAMLRPTKSRPLYAQAIGRGTRIAPMKENLLLLDFLWLSQKHNLVRPAHLVAASEDMAQAITQLSFESGGSEDLEALASTAQQKREEKLRRELEAKSRKQAFSADAMEFCLNVGSLATAEWEDCMEWHTRPPSEKQLALIQGAGIAPDSIRSRGHASAVIELIQSRRKLKLATPKQVKMLIKFQHAAPHAATFEQASAFISSKLRRYSRAA